ncbi:MAG: HDIG domain-containing protein [Bacteroidota bacterium]|nr:HDIG domain-containing protein [Bacteroidota bacterium]
MVNKLLLKNRNKIYRSIIFFSSFIIIFFSFQKERKFGFDLHKGKPWQHENLIAPFDFSIHKLEKEIQIEKDSIENNQKINFIYSESIKEDVYKKLKEDFENQWLVLLQIDSIKRKNDNQYRYQARPKKSQYIAYFNKLLKHTDFVYSKGIFDPSEILKFTNKTNYKLVFQRNKYIKTYTREQVFTLKTAYEYVQNKFEIDIENDRNEEDVKSFFKKLGIEKHINKNLFFNQQKTIEYQKLENDKISKTRGFIQGGELIISEGQIITLDKFRILLSLKNYYEHARGNQSIFLVFLGNAFVILIILSMLMIHLSNNNKKLYKDFSAMILIFMLLVIFVGFSNIIFRFSLFNIYIFPLALLPLIIKTFFDERLSLFILLSSIILIGFNVSNSFEYMVIQFIGGFAAIFGITHLNRRGQLYFSAISSFAAMSLVYVSISIIQEGSLSSVNWINILYFAIYGLLLLSAYPLIYIFERLFGFVTDVTLLELSNTNHVLLQKLATTAPGSFQHSLQVSNLAQAAANRVNANALLVKVGALYHDIGKTATPAFFIENQVSGFNPHDQIDFDQSAKIILNHITQGIAIAKKHSLPEDIIDFIRTHHGTTTVQYFYKNYIKKYPDKKDEIEKFTYPGPKPSTKETVILMMADSIEAASRSMKDINKESINNLVDKIIDYQMEMRQYDQADITFEEIYTIKNLFKELISNIYHARIEYPK